MFCKNCGRELDDGVKFCDGCGSPVSYDNNVIAQESPVTSAESIVKASFLFKKITCSWY